LLDDAGTDQETFADFINEVLQSLKVSNLENDQHRVLLWDNLSAHMTALVYNTVHGRPTPNVFTIIPRPPYQPKYGPTEYHFAELCARLRQRVQPDWTRDILKLEILNILSELGRGGRAHNTFHYCLNFE
jgi:transposase